jgi:hypothetical protein
VKIYQKLEEAQERIVHPQKRADVIKLVDAVMARILELKLVFVTLLPFLLLFVSRNKGLLCL